MEKVRIGFVGVGGMGQCAHLRNYASLPECEVVALAEIRPELARTAAARYNIPRVYPDHAALLANERLDALVASQPYARHGVLLPDLYKAGVPVFTEKPLARSIEAGERLLAALNKTTARHLVGYHKRSDPAVMYARGVMDDWKRSGKMGALRYVRLLMPAGDWVAAGFNELVISNDTMPALEVDPPPAGMGPNSQKQYDAFVNYYIHQVNLMRHLLGEPYAVSYADPRGVLLVVHGASGVTGSIEMSPYVTTVDWQEHAFIAFEKGHITVHLPAPLAHNRPGRVVVYADPGGVTPECREPRLPWVHAMRQQAINFVKAVRGEPTPLCEAAEALEDLNLARDYMLHLKNSLAD